MPGLDTFTNEIHGNPQGGVWPRGRQLIFTLCGADTMSRRNPVEAPSLALRFEANLVCNHLVEGLSVPYRY